LCDFKLDVKYDCRGRVHIFHSCLYFLVMSYAVDVANSGNSHSDDDHAKADLVHLMKCFQTEHEVSARELAELWLEAQDSTASGGNTGCSSSSSSTSCANTVPGVPVVSPYDIELLVKKWWMRRLRVSERVVDFVSFNNKHSLGSEVLQQNNDFGGCNICRVMAESAPVSQSAPKMTFGDLLFLTADQCRCQCSGALSSSDGIAAPPSRGCRGHSKNPNERKPLDLTAQHPAIRRHWDALILEYLGTWLSEDRGLRSEEIDTVAEYMLFKVESAMRGVLSVLEPVVQHCLRLHGAWAHKVPGESAGAGGVLSSRNLPPALVKAANSSSFGATKLYSAVDCAIAPTSEASGSNGSSDHAVLLATAAGFAAMASDAAAAPTDLQPPPPLIKSKWGKRGPYKKRGSAAVDAQGTETGDKVVCEAGGDNEGGHAPTGGKRARKTTEAVAVAEASVTAAALQTDVGAPAAGGDTGCHPVGSGGASQDTAPPPMEVRVTAEHILHCLEALVTEGGGAEEDSSVSAPGAGIIVLSAEVLERVRRRLSGK
jgi:hypothetical protein